MIKISEWNLEQHPLAKNVPPMTDEEFEILKMDIAQNDMRDPIILLEGKVIDGWNRYRALRELGKDVPDTYKAPYDPLQDGDDPEAFVLSRNLKRRHLTAGQKAKLGWEKLKAQIAQLKEQGLLAKPGPKTAADGIVVSRDTKTIEELTEVASGEAGTNVLAIKKFKALEKQSPEEAAEVGAGKKSLNTAKKEAKAQVDPEDVDKALERIKKHCGAEFYDALCSGAIKLKPDETVAFGLKGPAIMKKYQPLLEAGWSFKRSMRLERVEVIDDDPIQFLLDHCFANEGKLSIRIGDFKIRVTYEPQEQSTEVGGQ